MLSTEFKLFCYLAKNAAVVMSPDQVFQAINGRQYDGFDRSLDVLNSVLRKHFGDDPQNPKKIKTIRGKGISLCLRCLVIPMSKIYLSLMLTLVRA